MGLMGPMGLIRCAMHGGVCCFRGYSGAIGRGAIPMRSAGTECTTEASEVNEGPYLKLLTSIPTFIEVNEGKESLACNWLYFFMGARGTCIWLYLPVIHLYL